MKRSNLPSCMYFKHGKYYLVKKNKWHPLGASYPLAMAEYARLITAKNGKNEVAELVNDTVTELSETIKASTLNQYRLCEKNIAYAFQDFTIMQVRAKDIHEFMQANKSTPNLANRMLSVLRMSFNRAVILDLCSHNPCLSVARLKEHKRDRLMTHDEFMAIRSYPNDTLKCVMDLCYLTAQRISDVLKIKLSDISKEGIYFEQKKTGKKLFVSMSKDMQKAIDRAKIMNPKGVTPIYLLGLSSGKIRSYKGVSDLFARARTQANVLDVTLHDIRAMALTRADKMGLDAKSLAGHSTEQQTKTYLRDKSAIEVVGVGSIK